jgi:subtilisin family serine protease
VYFVNCFIVNCFIVQSFIVPSKRKMTCRLVRLRHSLGCGGMFKQPISSAPLTRFLSPFRIFLLSSALALSACSGGGGGGGSNAIGSAVPSENTPVSEQNLAMSSVSQTQEQWELDPEYNGNAGLDRISAAGAYASGASGAGQVIGFLDTGIDADHPEFASPAGSREPKIVYNNVSDLPEAPSNAQLRHGTSVASIAAAAHGSGDVLQGVAFDAQIAMWSLNLSSDNYYDLNGPLIKRAYTDLAGAGARIINNSWTLDDVFDANDQTSQARSLETYFDISSMARANIIHVFAAGNMGQSEVATTAGLPIYFPELVGKAVTVTSIGQGGRIDSQANQCGVARAFCLAAPGGFDGIGGFINAAGAGGGYNSVRGTSFSAAYVSGVLAMMRQVFGDQLSEAQYLDRLLDTAQKDGIYADSSIYGQGLLDAEQAVSPVGGLAAPASSGDHFGLSETWFSSQGDGVGGFSDDVAALSMVALDARGDPFSVSLGGLMKFEPRHTMFDFAWQQRKQTEVISKQLSLTNYAISPATHHPVFNTNTMLKGFMLREANMSVSQLDYSFLGSGSWTSKLETIIAYDRDFTSPEIAVGLTIAPDNLAFPRIIVGTVHDLNGFHGVQGRGALSTEGVGQLVYIGLGQDHAFANGWTISGNAQYGTGKLKPRAGLVRSININNVAAAKLSLQKGRSMLSLSQEAYSQDAYMDIHIPMRRDTSGAINFSDQRLSMFSQRPIALQYRQYNEKGDAQRYVKFEQKGDGSVTAQLGFEWLF